MYDSALCAGPNVGRFRRRAIGISQFKWGWEGRKSNYANATKLKDRRKTAACRNSLCFDPITGVQLRAVRAMCEACVRRMGRVRLRARCINTLSILLQK